MKKIYLIFLAVAIGSSSYGQYAKQATIPLKTQAGKSIKSVTPSPNDKGTTIWSNDFTTPSDWTIASNGDDWIIGSGIAPSGAFMINPLTSTSGGNFAMFDSDLMCSGNQDATLTINTPINLTGNSNVSMVFEQYYRKYQDITYIGVSTDGGANWTDIEVNSTISGNDFNGGDINSNPNLVSVNISAIAGNQAAVLIRFHYVGGCDYAWMVDDVEIQVTDNNDLTVSNEYYGTFFMPYTRIPVDQIQPIDFSILATNVGAVAQTNTMLTADINGGLFTGTSATTTVAVGGADSLFTTTQFTPSTTPGISYTATLTVSSDSVDATPSSNSVSFPPFEVSPFIYALDDYGTPGNAGGYDSQTSPPIEEFEAGNFYDVFVAATVTSIEVVIGTDADVGCAIDVVVYDWTTGSPVEVDRAFPYVITAGDLGVTKTLLLPNTPTLVAGNTYFAAVHAFGGGSEFFYGWSGDSPDGSGTAAQTSLIFYPDMVNGTQNYYTSQTPMVRMNFDPNVGVNNVDNTKFGFNVYPNPSVGEFNINLTSAEENNVELTVTNVVGEVIINKSIAVNGKTTESISLTDYSKGVYFLTVGNETVKLIVE